MLADFTNVINHEAELAVLGGILIDNDSIIRVKRIIDADDFYDDRHRKIFQAAIDLEKQNCPADIVGLSTMLKEREQFDEAGGIEYFMHLVDFVPTSANATYYAKCVKEKSWLRRLVLMANDMTTEICKGKTPQYQILALREELGNRDGW